MFAAGISHYDSPPPDVLDDLEGMRDADAYRFANRIHAWAEFSGGRPVDYGVEGGVVIGSTTVRLGRLGATFAAVPLPDLRAPAETGDGWVRFTQTAGGRTALPFPRTLARAPFVRWQAPLVWTTLSLTLHADGRSAVGLVGASPFPRHWVYDSADRLCLKAGVADFKAWAGQIATPWGAEDSPVVVTAAETALERELSTRLMHGGARPVVRELRQGEVLVRQGDPGDSLFLLLDGVVSVDVGGGVLAELGPGAVLGERALLEGGSRTATLTAVTPVRVAEAPADAIDRSFLVRLAEGHRRERSGL
ncbi:cyclic nucleotide-binding domain-containing protein [Planobispora longispora]|nr:cyclic nucleotide-binding domain-containing protein [Planobispora longispora]